MILVDYNGAMIASILAATGFSNDFSEDLARHTVLNCITSYRKKFMREYGEVVICLEGGKTWRRDFFPYYKANRRQETTDPNAIDWEELYAILNKIAQELRDHMPYKVVSLLGAEADDVIAVIAKRDPSRHIIISNDKDFGQLQSLGNVSQWAPSKQTELKIKNPGEFLKEMIIRGDTTDGVPNILSDDDVRVVPGKRQKPIRSKMLEQWLHEPLESFADPDKVKRNLTLISFDYIPEDIEEGIWSAYTTCTPKNRNGMLSYFSANRLRSHIEDIQHF